RKTFDLEGNLLTLTRAGKPDSAGIGALTTTWRYDLAGRRLVEVAPDGINKDSTVYDAASNASVQVTRRLDQITMGYDALNRLVSRITPSKSFASTSNGYGWIWPAFCPAANGGLTITNTGGCGY